MQSYVDDRIRKVTSPAFYNWTDTLSDIPQKFYCTHMYEYLMKREVIVLSADRAAELAANTDLYTLDCCLLPLAALRERRS